MTEPANRGSWRRRTGIAVALAGGVCVVLALTALVWFDFSYTDSTGLFHPDVSAARDFADSPNGPRFMRNYAQWIGWLMLALTSVAAAVSVLTTRLHRTAVGVTSTLALLGGAASTFNLVSLTNNFYGDWHDVVSHMSVGIPVAVAGFLAVGVGASLAAWHRTAGTAA